MSTNSSALAWQDREISPKQLRDEVLSSLSEVPKTLPSNLFYDERGSLLFDCLCMMPEYYPVRTEIAIIKRHIHEIAPVLGTDYVWLENWARGSRNNNAILDCWEEVLSRRLINECRSTTVGRGEPTVRQPLRIVPSCGDVKSPRKLGSPERGRPIICLPGTTFGNLPPREAQQLLEEAAALCGPKGGILIGVNLKQDVNILERAYNDRLGIAAAFNLNVLERLNRELNADFNVRWFQHRAFYESKRGRIEMQLVSLRDQLVHVDGASVSLKPYEIIRTGLNHQYTLPEFARLAKTSGLRVEHVWLDEMRLCGVHYLEPDSC